MSETWHDYLVEARHVYHDFRRLYTTNADGPARAAANITTAWEVPAGSTITVWELDRDKRWTAAVVVSTPGREVTR